MYCGKRQAAFFGYGEHTGSVGRGHSQSSPDCVPVKGREGVLCPAGPDDGPGCRSLSIKRKVISTLLKNGLYPYTACYLTDFDNHFSSIGVIGMNEAGLNAQWLKAGLESGETKKFAVSVLNHMREKLIGYQMEYGNLYGLGSNARRVSYLPFRQAGP